MTRLRTRIRRIVQGKLAALRERAEEGWLQGDDPLEPDPEPTRERVRPPPLSPTPSTRGADLAILELPPGATRAEIKAAYRRLCKRYHPDRFANDPGKLGVANALLAQINRAYAALRRGER